MRQTEKQVWQANSGHVAWPTVALALVALASQLALIALHGVGRVGDVTTLVLATLVAYVSFTPLHEAAHGNVAGRNPALQFLDPLCGWLSALQLAAPFPAFRVLHLTHHSHTNKPDHDPDMWVAAHGTWRITRALSLLVRCATLLPHYYYQFFAGPVSQQKSARTERTKALVTFVALVLVSAGVVMAGHASTLVLAWLLPAWIATGLLGLLFDWLPHRPHNVRGRYKDTRAIDAPLGVPLLGQHLHLVHHLYPRVPFYLYRRVFDALRPTLEERGARIDGPKPRPLSRQPSELVPE